MEGPSVLTLGVLDPEQWLLRESGLLTRANWGRLSTTISGVRFVQAEVDRTTDGVDITFYVAGAYRLKTIKNKPFTLARGRWTRVDMIDSICKEAGVDFNRLDGDVKQPIEGFDRDELRELSASESSQISQNFQRATRARGVLNGKGIKIKGAKATREQLRNLEVVLAQADADGAQGRARLALILSVIVESRALNLLGGDRDSSGILQLRASTANSLRVNHNINIDPRNIREVVHGYLTHGYGRMFPQGAIKLANRLPHWSAMQIASGTNQGFLASAYIAELTRWQDEGLKIIRAWAGADEDADIEDLNARTGTPDRTRIDRFQFRVENDETYYGAADRIAEEVNWRFWVQGNDANHPNGLAWFASDLILARATPSLVIREGASGVDRITWSADLTREIDSMTVDARAPAWVAVPGQVVVVEGQGDVADGRWLIRSIERDLLDQSLTCTVSLGRAEDPKLEPKPTLTTIPGSDPIGDPKESSGSENGRKFRQRTLLAQLVKKMDEIASRNLPYAYGGGHNSQFAPSPGTAHRGYGATHVGYDCSGAVSAVLHSAGLLDNALTSGALMNWGYAGEGEHITVWTNPNHVFFIVKFPDGTKKLWEASPPDGGNWRPMRSTSGYVARHWPGM